MKLNLILGKKQIVLASLVLILGAAIYLNYSFSKELALRHHRRDIRIGVGYRSLR
mgnify:CR=1 FL=1